jgi:hypothetical protein
MAPWWMSLKQRSCFVQVGDTKAGEMLIVYMVLVKAAPQHS